MTATTLLPGAYTATGYHAANEIRKSGRPRPTSASGDRHDRRDRELLGAEGERLERSNFLYETLNNRSEELVLGRTGFKFQSLTGDEELDARIEADQKTWAKNPEVTGRHDWRECESLAYRAFLNRGDLGVVNLDSGQIQYIESPRITGGRDRKTKASKTRGWRIEQGVELDSLGRTLAYWVAPYSEDGRIQANKAVRIKRKDMFLFANYKRFSQTRGIPEQANIFSLAHRLNDILDSEAIAWQQLARLTVLFSFEGGPSVGQALSGPTGDPAPGTNEPPDLSERILDFEQGTTIWGKPGETVKPVNRDFPGSNFPESVKTFIQLIGMKGGIPLSILMLDYRGVNYTGARGELEQAYRTVCRRQNVLITGHHDPITKWRLERGVRDGRYPKPPRGKTFDEFYLWNWDAPKFPWIDQLAESKAWGSRMDRGLATQRMAHQSLGIDSEEFMAERETEFRNARALAKKLTEEDPDRPVDWRMILGYEVSRNKNEQIVDEVKAELGQTDKGGESRPKPGA